MKRQPIMGLNEYMPPVQVDGSKYARGGYVEDWRTTTIEWGTPTPRTKIDWDALATTIYVSLTTA